VSLCRTENTEWLGGHVKKKNAERQARWVQVEALCLCARLEREGGEIEDLSLVTHDYPPSVIAEAQRLSARRRRPSQVSTFGRWLRAVLKFPNWAAAEPARTCCLLLVCLAIWPS
jgi:hypothetical protein